MKQGFRIVTYVYSNAKEVSPQHFEVAEMITGTYTIFRATLEEAVDVLRRRTRDPIQSATRITEEILY